ncbi:MAG: rhomboid family intramembrane serine protease [Paracoccaceae bacterium]
MSNDTNPNPNVSPVNPMPPVVIALFLVIFGIECFFALGSEELIGGPNAVGWRLQAIQKYAFSGPIFDWMVENNRWTVEHLMRFVTYPFISTSFTHALLVGVILLAMGKMVGEAFGGVATLIIFVVSGAVGALAYAVLLNDSVPLNGGFPPVYGLIGGFTYLLWRKLALVGAQQLRAFHLIGFLMGIQLIFGLLFESHNDWVADLAGFAAGFGLSFFLAPGSWSDILRRLRGN